MKIYTVKYDKMATDWLTNMGLFMTSHNPNHLNILFLNVNSSTYIESNKLQNVHIYVFQFSQKHIRYLIIDIAVMLSVNARQ